MRALPFLAALLCTAPMANAKSELELLQGRCAEMERQIHALETENSQLKSQAALSTKTVIETAKPAAKAEAPAAPATKEATKETAAEPATKAAASTATKAAASTATFATVRAGDTLNKVAKRNGTTAETLVKLNKIKNPSGLQIGQKLRLPAKAQAEAPAAVASKAKTSDKKAASPAPGAPAPAPIPQGGTHIVKAGETFYSIAHNYGLSDKALQAANPQIKADKLRAGQTLQLGGKAKTESAPATAKSKPVSEKASAPAASPAPKTAAAAPSPSATPSAPASEEETASQMVSNTPKLRLVTINDPIDFGAFAAAHGTNTAKLNALNGHNLNPSTVLAKGSEFYVPAQP
ncbi:LysM peptidoglycan-binding domain-containing protein [Luteolibacter soli]|uniref:LysM domain-containing protein n=1 Tax=Luteolibacter soli TaxID=3135280 RepID=A0ABU9ARG7_9BACT